MSNKLVDKNFFKKWSHTMSYILGFFAADGYITVNKRGGQYWCIQICDGDLLKKIKKTMKSEHKISVRKRFGNEHDLYRIQIGCKEMCNDVRRLGFSERKTKNMVIPKIPSKYFSHFVRGYFDGDGHVWTGLIHKNRKTKTRAIQTVFTSCSLVFLKMMMSKLKKYGIANGAIKCYKRGYYRLSYSIRSSLKLYNFMYNNMDNSDIFLERKNDKFKKYFESI